MKPYMKSSGKGWWSRYWGDKVPAKLKKVFKKSARQEGRKAERREG